MRGNLSERNSHPLRAGRQRRLVDYGRAVDYGQNGEREFRDRLHSGLETENPYLHLREFEEITTFTQKLGETLYQCWERYKELLNSCPHHGFETWRLVSHFYEGLTPQCRQMVEMVCNGEFSDKDPKETLEYLDLLAENAQNWNTAGTHEAPSKAQPPTSGGGMYNLKEEHDL
ncbi:hypothetical protein Q3G72_004562 [Acer saccharum]|nr:hypothetical protein Q3G72_004562 [Acer saccharum]